MQLEKKKFIHSLLFPLFFLFLIWLIKIIEHVLELNFVMFGIYPLKLEGLTGIITAPLVHSDFSHLIANSLPLLLLNIGIFYFYTKVAYKVFFLTYFITGLWVWFGARHAYHIGASGLIYGFASFLFFSGVIRKDIRLAALSLLVAFLYGGMVWGIFPFKEKISWESHLMGMVAGLVLAIYFKKHGPQRKKYEWEEEDDDGSSEVDITDDTQGIRYFYDC